MPVIYTHLQMKPTLLVLAAGMGSRYGGLKQMDPLGPGGETIIDYSIYDAVHSGFGKVVYIVREYFLGIPKGRNPGGRRMPYSWQGMS